MKINDVVLLDAKLPPKQSSKAISGILPKSDLIGSGYQALVYDMKRHPNSVIKVIPILGQHDSAYQFLRLSVNNQKNPFFPKIHSYKFYKVKELQPEEHAALAALDYLTLSDRSVFDATAIMLIVTERLKHSESGVLSAFANMGIPSESDLRAYIDYNIGLPRKCSYIITNYFRSAEKRNELRHKVDNADFKNAMRLLEPLFTHYYPDLHLNNFMIRDNGELVINDPIVQNTDAADLANLPEIKPAPEYQRKTKFDSLSQAEQDLISKYKGKVSSTNEFMRLPPEEQAEIKKAFTSVFRFLSWLR